MNLTSRLLSSALAVVTDHGSNSTLQEHRWLYRSSAFVQGMEAPRQDEGFAVCARQS